MRYGFLGLFFWLGFFATGQAALSVVDDSGATVTLEQPARRIISLAPHVTELLYAAGAGEYIVGAVAYSDYPEAAKQLPRVGSNNAFDIEAILAQSPDLLVAWQSGNPWGPIAKLRELGIPVFLSEPRALEDVAENLRRLGILTGTEQTANLEADTFLARLSGLRSRYQGKVPVTVFYQIWHQPLITINDEHIISEVIRLCGGRNIFANLPALAPKVGMESILSLDPQAIVAGGVAAVHPNWQQDWQAWPQLRAVKNSHLFHVNPDLMQRHTPRLLQGAEILCEQLDGLRK